MPAWLDCYPREASASSKHYHVGCLAHQPKLNQNEPVKKDLKSRLTACSPSLRQCSKQNFLDLVISPLLKCQESYQLRQAQTASQSGATPAILPWASSLRLPYHPQNHSKLPSKVTASSRQPPPPPG